MTAARSRSGDWHAATEHRANRGRHGRPTNRDVDRDPVCHGPSTAVEPADPAVDREAIRNGWPLKFRNARRRRAASFSSYAGSAFRSCWSVSLRRPRSGSPLKVGRKIEVCVASTDVARDRLKLALDDLAATTDADRLRVETATAGGRRLRRAQAQRRPAPRGSGDPGPVASLEDLIRARRARCTHEDRAAAQIAGRRHRGVAVSTR